MLDISSLPKIPVIWIVSQKGEEIKNSIVKPEKKADEILSLTLDGYENIREPFQGIEMNFMGFFREDNSPF